MGVDGLLVYAKKKNPNLLRTFYLSDLKGRRIAVDLAIQCYAKKSESISKQASSINLITGSMDYTKATNNMYRRVLEIINIICIAGCTPVIVFDGKPPDLKGKTKLVRLERSVSTKDAINGLWELVRKIESNPEHILTPEELMFIKTVETKKKPISTLQDLKNRLRAKLAQWVTVTRNDYITLMQIFKVLGIPFIVAEDEAEKCCAHLCLKGVCSAIFSTDSDSLVYGTPLMINSIRYASSKKGVSPVATGYFFKTVLDSLEINHYQFIQFCIMLGNDFNPRVPGYGAKKCHDLLLEYGSLEGIQQKRDELIIASKLIGAKKFKGIELKCFKYNQTCLNYDEVVSFFTTPSTPHLKFKDVEYDEESCKRVDEVLPIIMGSELFMSCLSVIRDLTSHMIAISKRREMSQSQDEDNVEMARK